MKRPLFGLLLAGLIAPPAVLAQVGQPGVTQPPAVPIATSLPPALASGVTVSGTAETILFKLDGDSAATQTFLSMTNVAKPTTNFITMTGSTTLGVLNLRAESDSGNNYFTLLSLDADNPWVLLQAGLQDNSEYAQLRIVPDPNALHYNTFSSDDTVIDFNLQDTTANTFLSFTNVATPANTITLAQNTSVPSLTTTLSDGTNTYVQTLRATGATQTGLTNAAIAAPALASLVKGGYTLDGTTTSGSPDTVKVTIVDTTPSITDGDVQVCGYATTAHQTATGPVTCETRDFSGGAGNQTTTQTYVEILYIKSSSFTVLGGGGDETIAAEWTVGAVSILAAVNLVNSGASDYSVSFPTGLSATNFAAIKCLDLEGCAMGIPAGTNNGQELTLVALNGTTSLTFADSATMKVSASHTLNGYDTIRFIYAQLDTAWVQVSVAVN